MLFGSVKVQFSQFKVSAISIAVLAAFTAPLAMAQTVVGDADDYIIQADTDNGGAGEVILESFNGGGTHTTLVVGDNGVSINKALTVTGGITGASVNTGSGSITTTGAVSAGTVTSTTVGATTGNITTVNSTTLANTGTATLGTLSVTNNAGVGGTLSVTGATTTNGLANTGAFTQSGTSNMTGTTNVTGTANINTSGTATTNIGTAGGATNLGSAASTNTILGTTSATGDTTINGAGTFATQIGGAGASAVTVSSGASSVTTTNTGVSVVGNVSNSLTATTGSNTIQANTGNTLATTTGNNVINALGTGGRNDLTANLTTGVNNIEAKYNNIGVTTGASINAIGNTTVGTTVSSYGGTGYSVLNNTSATFGTNAALNGTTGGMVQTDATTASIRASNSGTLASNGSSGVMAVGAGGGYTAYATAQSTGSGTIGGVVDNKSYTNKISGNTYIDGNVYINGTLDYVSSNSANTSVIGATSATSVLAGATQATTAGTAIVLKGSTGTQTVVDANGKLTNVTGTATESTASLTLTNGVGNTHGLVVTESQSTLSGGVNSSSLTLSDNGATFSDSATGAPVQVHGVNDGTSDFDAVNIRQFSGAIASVTAMANIPQVDQDKTYAVGVGLGSFMGKTALAAGVTYRFTRNGVLKGSISSAMGSSNTTTYGVGAAWSY